MRAVTPQRLVAQAALVVVLAVGLDVPAALAQVDNAPPPATAPSTSTPTTVVDPFGGWSTTTVPAVGDEDTNVADDTTPGFFDFGGKVRRAINGWFRALVEDALEPVLNLVGRTILSTPDFTGPGRVRELWLVSWGIANGIFVLFIVAAGVIAMGYESLQSRYTVKELLPRLVLGFVGANASLFLAHVSIGMANALSQAFVGQGVSGDGAVATMGALVLGAMAGGGIFITLIAIVVVILALGLIGVYVVRICTMVVLWFLRHKHRTPGGWSPPPPRSAPWSSAGGEAAAVAVEDDPPRPEPEPLLDFAGNRICLEGPGSLAAIRAAIVEALTGDAEPPNIVVLARGELANLFGPGAGHPAMRVVEDEDMLVSELDVAQLQRQRAAIEAQEDGQAPEPSWKALVVAPGPLHDRTRAHPALRDATAVCLGRDPAYPLVFVGADGTITVPGEAEGSRGVEVMTTAEATAALAAVAPATDASLAVHPAGGAQTTTEEAGSAPPISVRVLGSYRIAVRGEEVTSGLRAKARELLAYFVLHREGATMDAAMEALWPETDPLKGQAYFRTIVANLRTTLRSGAGLEDGLAVVERVGPRYRLAPGLVAVDLWAFDDALRAANQGDPKAREVAADSCGGDFTAGEDYLWAEPTRQQVQRKAIDNLTALAEQRRAGGDLEGAVQFLERAIEADPYAEDQYRAVMELQLSLGRRDAATRTLGLLEHRLGELELRPAEVTRQILTRDLG